MDYDHQFASDLQVASHLVQAAQQIQAALDRGVAPETKSKINDFINTAIEKLVNALRELNGR